MPSEKAEANKGHKMINLSQFAKKVDVDTPAKDKTASCLESMSITGNKITLVLNLNDYAKAKTTQSGKEIYLNFTCPKQNIELDGVEVGLRVAGNAFIGQAK